MQKVKARDSYQAYCMNCHGRTGNGRDHAGTALVAIDFTAPAASANLNREIIVEAVLSGHDEATRSGWANELDEPQVDGIATYIREAFILPTPALDSSVGQQIYAKTCSVCHGERGDGVSLARNSLSPSPRDFTGPDSLKLSRRDMINTVTYGNDSTAMMPFASQYSPGEIAAVVDYIREKFMAIEDSDAHHDGQMASVGKHAAHGHSGADEGMTATFPNALVGDVAKGKTFFDNNCADCHGKTGAGDGPRAYFINPKPRDLTSPKTRVELNRPLLFSAIANGVRLREMAAWSKVLDDQQIADVAEYVFRTFIQPGDLETSDPHHSDHADDMPAHGHSTEPAADDTHSADGHGHGHGSQDVKKKLNCDELNTPTHQKGASLYNRHCYFCHGYHGDAETVAAEFLVPPPRDFTDPSGLAPERIAEAIRNGRDGTAMKPFRGILSDEDIDAVAQYVFDTFSTCRLAPANYHSVENGWPDHEKRYGPAFPFVLGEIPLDRPANPMTEREQWGLSTYLSACVTCHERDGARQAAGPDSGSHHSRQDEAAPFVVVGPTAMSSTIASTGYGFGKQTGSDHAEWGNEGYGYGLGNGPHDTPPIIPDLTPFEDWGEHLYLDNCAYCHAADGTGRNWIGTFLDPQPPDFTDKTITSGYTDESIRQSTVKGLPETSMPAFGSVMTEKQVTAIIAYMRRAFLDKPRHDQ